MRIDAGCQIAPVAKAAPGTVSSQSPRQTFEDRYRRHNPKMLDALETARAEDATQRVL